jgi:hypothetical protein
VRGLVIVRLAVIRRPGGPAHEDGAEAPATDDQDQRADEDESAHHEGEGRSGGLTWARHECQYEAAGGEQEDVTGAALGSGEQAPGG